MAGFEFRNSGLGRDIQQPAPEGERVVPLVLREDTFPLDDVAGQHPEEFKRLVQLTRGLHETARLMLYQNVRK